MPKTFAETAAQQISLTTHIDTLGTRLGGPFRSLPRKSTMSQLMKHGGFQILTTAGSVMMRLKRYMPDQEDAQLAQVAVKIKSKAEMFFQRLSPKRYGIPSELISYLTFPHEGTTYTDPAAPELENPTIPAAFTFVGQFIDHDLTFNGANLFDDQTGTAVPDFASPVIDLDSVYGGRSYPNDPADTSLKGIITNSDVFNDDMSFKLLRLGVNAYDVRRWIDATEPDRVGAAYIFDPRNDENQLILQVHILVMRVHNKLLKMTYEKDKKLNPKDKKDAAKAAAKVKAEVIANWQSVVLNDFLPRVCEQDTLTEVLKQIQLPGHGNLKYKPSRDGSLQMPHEFAIGFRFGHSMLRNEYALNSLGPVALFNNRDLERKGDLRGGRALSRNHVIDWDVFYPKDEFDAELSLKIDSKVTPVVFDLPESTIPDAVKTVGNLPFRNLTRSREIDIACGEDLCEFFGIAASKRLTPLQVEPDDEAHYLYEADVDTYAKPNGVGEPPADDPLKGVKDTRFKTPLWYYILKEAELLENGERLGPLGSRLVAEVICGGIFYGKDTKFDYKWKSEITKSNVVMLRDLIDFVNEAPPMLVGSVEDVQG
ncbi:MAG: peroxidase family protein [Silvibacterium sp.]